MEKTKFNELKQVFKTLHGPKGCAWDKEQTFQSLIKSLKEETQELIDAIENGKSEYIKEELGDVLLLVMFYAQMAEKQKKFNIEDIIDVLIKKLKRRHPHVFEKTKAISSAEVVENWKKIKGQERA